MVGAHQIKQGDDGRKAGPKLKTSAQLCGEGSVSNAVRPDAKCPRLLRTIAGRSQCGILICLVSRFAPQCAGRQRPWPGGRACPSKSRILAMRNGSFSPRMELRLPERQPAFPVWKARHKNAASDMRPHHRRIGFMPQAEQPGHSEARAICLYQSRLLGTALHRTEGSGTMQNLLWRQNLTRPVGRFAARAHGNPVCISVSSTTCVMNRAALRARYGASNATRCSPTQMRDRAPQQAANSAWLGAVGCLPRARAIV